MSAIGYNIFTVTRADGEKVYVAIEHIGAWERAPGGSAGTALFISGTILYVRETPEEIAALFTR
jgi:uncharacterized protein YlzI (FlbEa/FlbD family)